eukprot:jgi/Chlat1/3722/Chrsp258S03871
MYTTELVIVACDEHYERFSLKVPTEDDKMGAGTHDEYTNIANKVYEEQNRFGCASESPRVGVLSVPELRKNETELTDKWRNEVQDAMDTIQAFMQTSPDYYADFRAYRASDDSPQEGPLKRVERARRVLRDFWRSAYKWYMDGMLPPDLFSKSNVWCARGNTFRLMVEPIDIANYYRLELWKQWPVGNRHYLEADNRPEYYTFLELQYEKHNKTAPPSSTQRALDEMDAIESK